MAGKRASGANCSRPCYTMAAPSRQRSSSAAGIFASTSEADGFVIAPFYGTLHVSAQRAQQRFEGWGTSLCWFANIPYALAAKRQLADLLFDPKLGLGMQIVRYNIGGAGWGSQDVKNFRYGASIPSFWGPDGTWDWSLDAEQRWWLLAAKERASGFIAEAFSNSPPYWMTISGRSSGNRNPRYDNLAPEAYDAFIHYLTEVVAHYHKEHGVTFRTLDPFNEPDTFYWWMGNNQEGCRFCPAAQNIILPKLHARLEETGLLAAGVSISASDETSIDTACSSFCSYTQQSLAAVAQVNTHAYQGSKRAQLRDMVRPAGKRLWMSEYGCGSFVPGDIGSGLELSRCILADLNVLQADAWIYWQAIENGDSANSWGLMQVPFHTPTTVTIGKQFYALAQYSKFIRSGDTILATDDPNGTVAALRGRAPDGADDAAGVTITLVKTTFVGQSVTCDVDLSGFASSGASGGTVNVFRTSQAENFQQVERFTLTGLEFCTTLMPLSITTFVIKLNASP
ncbi:hypothetical protein WJX72_005628 [[Myrmecia] bisecta]|uniref:Endo-beta-1,6-galactanase-like domain-containing protein n=1 Tax=[Myrmecia] bisecta TaxID=41462 RepID=A0AAW1PII7_9CHLO